MALSDEAIGRLASLGITTDDELESWRRLWAGAGESSFWSYLALMEDSAAAYRHWSPRLRAYAARCRREDPAPPLAELSPVEAEQRRVLLRKMAEFVRAGTFARMIRPRSERILVVIGTMRAALAPAQEVFGGPDVVVLQQAEVSRWFADVYQGDPEGPWWYVRAWFTIEDGPPAGDPGFDEAAFRHHFPIPPGSAYWMVASGDIWGPLAGGCSTETWSWDGSRAEFLGDHTIDIF